MCRGLGTFGDKQLWKLCYPIVSADLPRKIPPTLHKSASFRQCRPLLDHARLNGGIIPLTLYTHTEMYNSSNSLLRKGVVKQFPHFCVQLSQRSLQSAQEKQIIEIKEAEEERLPVH